MVDFIFVRKNNLDISSEWQKKKRGRGIFQGGLIFGSYCIVLRNAESLDECLGGQGFVPQVGCHTPRVGTCEPWFLLCSPVPFGTSCEGVSWSACFLSSFPPSIPVHSSAPPTCSRFSWHCSWTVQYLFWDQGRGRTLLKNLSKPNLYSAELWSYVIYRLKLEIWVHWTLDSDRSSSGFVACICHCFQILKGLW